MLMLKVVHDRILSKTIKLSDEMHLEKVKELEEKIKFLEENFARLRKSLGGRFDITEKDLEIGKRFLWCGEPRVLVKKSNGKYAIINVDEPSAKNQLGEVDTLGDVLNYMLTHNYLLPNEAARE